MLDKQSKSVRLTWEHTFSARGWHSPNGLAYWMTYSVSLLVVPTCAALFVPHTSTVGDYFFRLTNHATTNILVGALGGAALASGLYMWFKRGVVSTRTETIEVNLGSDGVAIRDDFFPWRAIQSIGIEGEDIVITVSGMPDIRLPAPKTNLKPTVKRLRAAKRTYESLVVPPTISASELGELTTVDTYRSSNRGTLVRVASSPKANFETRMRAIEALSADHEALQEVEGSVDSMVDVDVAHALRKVLDKARAG